MFPRTTPERLNAFSDGVFAVLITVLVLALRPPALPTFKALLSEWPTWISYASSYLFIAIIWLNHHYLLGFATETSHRLFWFNFMHMFSISILPFSTAWMAASRLAAAPVAFYAVVFFLVNATYIALIWEIIDRSTECKIARSARRIMHVRAFATLALFTLSALTALRYPLIGFAICFCCPLVYLRPEPQRRLAS